MVYNRRDLKVISIIQIVMTAIFFALAMLDRFQVRFISSSFAFAPCWTAAPVLTVGVIGLILSKMPRRSLSLIFVLKSMCIACAAASAATIYHYHWAIGILLHVKYLDQGTISSLFVNKETKLKFTDQENTMLAISSLAIVFSVMEIILAFASAKSCPDASYEPLQENQTGGAYINPLNQLGAEHVPLQPPPYLAAQPMFAVPVSCNNANQ